MSLRDGVNVRLRGGIQIPAARQFFGGKLRGGIFIQPEAKKDWARGGCAGAKSQRPDDFPVGGTTSD